MMDEWCDDIQPCFSGAFLEQDQDMLAHDQKEDISNNGVNDEESHGYCPGLAR